MVTPAGFEPAIFWMRTRYPKPLDDGAPFVTLSKWVYGRGQRCFAQFASINVQFPNGSTGNYSITDGECQGVSGIFIPLHLY